MTHFLAGIFDIVVGTAMLLIFTRFMLQFADVDRKNPFVATIFSLTKVVDVFGRIFPTLANGKINTSALMILFLFRLIFFAGVISLLKVDSQNIGLFNLNEYNMQVLHHLGRYFSPFMLVFVTLITLITDFLRMCKYLIIASFIISWIVFFSEKLHPSLDLINQLSEPIITPFRKIIPPAGMFDLAPMIGFFIIILLENIVQIFGIYLLSL